MYLLKRLLIRVAFLMSVGLTTVMPSVLWAVPLPDALLPVGEARLKILWFDIYHAELFSDTGEYKGTTGPLYLKLTYQRDINKNDLLKETRKQMTLQLGTAYPEVSRLNQWIEALRQLWPDISKHDSLSFYLSESGVGHFYYNQHYIGSIEDDVFGSVFLNIWLSKHSSFPKITKKLIGEA